MTHAVKSALPEAALDPSRESFVLQTAPLWPRKVPIQSPVHSLNIGFPSLQLDTRRKVPSSWIGEKERCVMGRVWPGATRGVDLKWVDIRTKKRKIQIGVCRDDRWYRRAALWPGDEERTLRNAWWGPSVCCCWGCHAPSIVLAFLDPAKGLCFLQWSLHWHLGPMSTRIACLLSNHSGSAETMCLWELAECA